MVQFIKNLQSVTRENGGKFEKEKKINRQNIITLADGIQNIRPDWTHTGIVNQLTTLTQNWTGTDAELAMHAYAIAGNPAANTPGALNSPMPATARKTTSTEPTTKEPRCFICGNTKTQCEQLNDFEKRRGIPDPHDFESAEDAEQNSSRATAQRKLEAIAALAKSKSIPA